MDGIGPDDLNTQELMQRVTGGGVNEVILALGTTLEGDTTGFFLNRRLTEHKVMVSMLARGLSVGGDFARR
ncbi:MAG: toprim domain-containing protein [Flavobacteriales bacterium]